MSGVMAATAAPINPRSATNRRAPSSALKLASPEPPITLTACLTSKPACAQLASRLAQRTDQHARDLQLNIGCVGTEFDRFLAPRDAVGDRPGVRTLREDFVAAIASRFGGVT